MKAARVGDSVRINYTGKPTSGEVFDTSGGREPPEFTLDSRELLEIK